jgi:diguanylate cyclase (GGDEF)-like protein
MTTMNSLLAIPSTILRALAAFFQPSQETSGGSPSPASTSAPAAHSEPEKSLEVVSCQDPKFGLAVTLLAKVREGLSGHSVEIATFAEAIAPAANGTALPLEACANMQAANQILEELVESTVHRLKLVSGSLLAKEQSQLAAYKKKTSAFGKKLENIPSELVMTHAVAELLSTVQDLRRENESVRTEMVDAQKRLCQLAARVAAAEREARVDALTQLLNRRAFDEVHATCHAASQETPYCLVMIDIDHFKSINDEYGHAAGDAVLALIGRALRENCRAADHMARWGGEEFAILMPGINFTMALGVAERLRRKTEATILHYGPKEIRFTVSCGIVQSQPDSTQLQTLEEADIALFAAKQQGRNRSVVFGEDCRVSGTDTDVIPNLSADAIAV